MLRVLLPMTGLFLLLAAWQLVWSMNLIPRVLLPSVPAMLVKLVLLAGDAAFLNDVGQTVKRTVTTLLISLGLGVPIGLFIGPSQTLSRGTSSLIDFLRSIPAPALFPLAILFLGFGNASKISIATYACTLLLIVQTSHGVRQVSRFRRDVLTLARASRTQRMRYHLVPEIMPFIVAGSLIATSLALVLIVVAEMLMGGGDGLGGRISDAQAAYRIEELYATIVSTGILGFVANRLLRRVGEQLVYWECDIPASQRVSIT